jgi:hypothetical protein
MTALAGTVKSRTVAGETFRCSNRVYWHLLWTIFVLRVRFPKARLVIYQTCYHTGIAASAGTHDFDAVFDVWIRGGVLGRDPWRAQRFLRRHGWAAWFRHTGSWANAWHIHMVSIPPGLTANPTADEVERAFARLGIRVGVYVPGQVDDYYAHAFGLAGQHRAGSDRSWFPNNINRCVFRRRLWFRRTIV